MQPTDKPCGGFLLVLRIFMHQLPLQTAANAACFSSSKSLAPETDMTRLHVLIVDKDPKTRFLLSSLLHGKGFVVVGDTNGTFPVQSEVAPHLVVVGSTTTETDCLSIVRKARKAYPHCGITVLRDMQDFGAIALLLEAGAGSVLAAPVDTSMLLNELRRAGNRCIAKLATRCIVEFRAPESERHIRALPYQCAYPTGPQHAALHA
jgi:CheY-like chemotaxis protein